MPDHFVMFENYIKTVRRIKDKATRCEAYDAIMDYMLSDGKEPKFTDDASAAAFEGIRYGLDCSLKRSESGKKGGEANRKQTGSHSKANRKPKASNSKANSNDIDIDRDIELDKELNLGAAGSTKARPSPQ